MPIDDQLVPQVALNHYGLTVKTCCVLESGQINRSYRLTDQEGRFYVLQRLNDFLAPDKPGEHNFALAAEALSQRNLPAPLVIKTRAGHWLARVEKGAAAGWWRLLTGLEGSPPAKRDLKTAVGAARMLGLCHRALNEPRPLELWPQPPCELATNHHLCRADDFNKILTFYKGHPHLNAVGPFKAEGAELAHHNARHDQFKMLFRLKHMVIHGDPKLDNFLADARGLIKTLVDWDGVSYGHCLLDLADGLRSWTATPATEAEGLIFFQADYFLAALAAYQRYGLSFSLEELIMLPAAVRALALNLARRYLTDSLAEVYFAWNRKLYPSLHKQNLYKGRTMLALSRRLWASEAVLCRRIKLMNRPESGQAK